MATKIKLSNGMYALVDDINADLAKFDWHASKEGVYRIAADGKRIWMHGEVVERALERTPDYDDKSRFEPSTKYEGVYFDKLIGKWIAVITG